MFPRCLQYLLTDFRQTFVTGASWDTDDLIAFLGQKVKVQGHTIAAEAYSTRRYRRVLLFLVSAQNLIVDQIADQVGVMEFGHESVATQPRYASCSSVRPSVPFGILTRKQKNAENQN